VAYFLQQGRKSEEQTEFLLAQLEDAREQQLQAAAIAERARIASELHDVLAHSLSGAPIQLQGAPVRLPASTLLTPARGNANAVGRSYR
jgi:signal transduction histidine kinase